MGFAVCHCTVNLAMRNDMKRCVHLKYNVMGLGLNEPVGSRERNIKPDVTSCKCKSLGVSKRVTATSISIHLPNTSDKSIAQIQGYAHIHPQLRQNVGTHSYLHLTTWAT